MFVCLFALLHQQAADYPKELIEDVVMYGELVQAVYDTLLTKDVYSQCFGECYPDVAMEEGSTLASLSGPDGYFPYFTGPKAGQYKVGSSESCACASCARCACAGCANCACARCA